MTKQTKLKNVTDYHERLMENLADSEQAMAYLKVALEEYEDDADHNTFMRALRNVADAQGGIGTLARKAALDRTHLYRVLSSNGNPRLLTLDHILRAMGFRLSIVAA